MTTGPFCDHPEANKATYFPSPPATGQILSRKPVD